MYLTARLRWFFEALVMADQPITRCPLCHKPWSQCTCGGR